MTKVRKAGGDGRVEGNHWAREEETKSSVVPVPNPFSPDSEAMGLLLQITMFCLAIWVYAGVIVLQVPSPVGE